MACAWCFLPVKDRESKISKKNNNEEMAKKSNWFDALKKVFNPHHEEKKQPKEKHKKKWFFGRQKSMDPIASSSVEEIPLDNNKTDIASTSYTIPPPQSLLPQFDEIKEVKLSEIEGDENKHAYSVALASAVAAEAAAVAAQAAAEVVRLTRVGSANHLKATQKAAERAKEGIAAVKIQTAFRGFLARRALRALRGVARLKILVDGNTVKKQTEKTLHFIQSQTRIQSEIRSRRRQMVEEKQAVQKQNQLKQKDLDKLKMAEDWDLSLQTKEQIETSIQFRQGAAIRRERALAYAFSHQWKNPSSNRVSNPYLTDPHWGWSWVDRWILARPWESKPLSNPNPNPNSAPIPNSTPKKSSRPSSPKARSSSPKPVRVSSKEESSTSRNIGPINPNPKKSSRPPSPTTPRSKIRVSAEENSTSKTTATPNPNPNPRKSSRPPSPTTPRSKIRVSKEEDSRSVGSVKSERIRRHSVAGSIGDNSSLTSLISLPVIPSYLQSTESSRQKTRSVYSPINEKVDERGVGKKRMSFSGLRSVSPVKGRRFSGPPRVELVSLKDDE